MLIILDELLMRAQEESTHFFTLLYAIMLVACVMAAVSAYFMRSLSIVQKLGVGMLDSAPPQTPPKRCLCVY